jgi:hypothetical protein
MRSIDPSQKSVQLDPIYKGVFHYYYMSLYRVTYSLFALFGDEPDNAGRAKFTVNLWVPAGQALITEIDSMF